MNKVNIFLVCCLQFLLSVEAGAQNTLVKREKIEWSEIWVTNSGDTSVPRVLLIGNSITKGYYTEVSTLLEGKANVCKLVTSQFLSDPMLLSTITMLLDNYQFDIIHFNNGMHGWQHSEDEYKAGFIKFLTTLKLQAPNTKLIWCSTTPIKKDPMPGEINQPSNARIKKRNEIAIALLQNEQVKIDDLFTLMLGHDQTYADNLHFNKLGVALQAKQVAGIIEKVLAGGIN